MTRSKGDLSRDRVLLVFFFGWQLRRLWRFCCGWNWCGFLKTADWGERIYLGGFCDWEDLAEIDFLRREIYLWAFEGISRSWMWWKFWVFWSQTGRLLLDLKDLVEDCVKNCKNFNGQGSRADRNKLKILDMGKHLVLRIKCQILLMGRIEIMN